MTSYDLTEYLEDDGFVLEGIPSTAHPKESGGKAYRFESPSAEVGLWLRNLVDLGRNAALGIDVAKDDLEKLVLDDDEEKDLFRRVMGPTFDEMIADGVTWTRVQKVFRLLLRKFGSDQDIDDTIAADQGEAGARANRATRRAATKKPPAKRAASGSSRKAGSSSSRAFSGTPVRTRAQGSTRSSKTPAKATARKAG